MRSEKEQWLRAQVYRTAHRAGRGDCIYCGRAKAIIGASCKPCHEKKQQEQK